MNYRLSTIHSLETYSADTTEVIDINIADPISLILIELAVYGNGDLNTAHPLACLTKIEIVDGSDVLFSLSGKEAAALDFYHNKGLIRSPWNTALNNTWTDQQIALNFGRYLWDPELALDPRKFTNPQLKLTLDIDAGGNAADQNRLRVQAAIFDQKAITPMGFLMHKEIKDYAMASLAHEYTDLPVDYPYRKFLMRCQSSGHEPRALVRNVKISEDMDKRVIFNHGSEEIFRTIAINTPMIKEHWFIPIHTAVRYLYCTPTTRVAATGSIWAQTVTAGDLSFYNGDGGQLEMYAVTGAQNVQVMVEGWCPHGVWDIPMGIQDDIADWFDPTAIGSLRADIESRSAADSTDSVQIFLQQLRKYAA